MFNSGLILAFALLTIAVGPDRLFKLLERGITLYFEFRAHMDGIQSQLRRNHFHQSNFRRDPESPLNPFANFVVVLVFFVTLLFFLQDSGIFTAAWLMPFGPN